MMMNAVVKRSVSQGRFLLAVRSLSSAPAAHGGPLVNKMVSDPAEKADLAKQADVTVELNDRQSCDVELLTNGGFSPLGGYMNSGEYESVVENYRLPSGDLFGLPVVYDTNREDLTPGKKVLFTYKGQDIALFNVEDRFKPDKVNECKKTFGTSELEHPGCRVVAFERGHTYLGGDLIGLNKPERVFPCATPLEVRQLISSAKDVVAFQCRNPLHQAHYNLAIRSLDADSVDKDNALLLINPTCGPTQEDDISGEVRYKTYLVLKKELDEADPNNKIRWAYLPYSMLMAGPREALQHMMIRKNFGCTHFVVGRDMAGSKSSITGEDYYGAYDAQDFAGSIADELGVKTIPSLNLVSTDEAGYITADEAKEKGYKANKLSGTEFRRRLRAGEDIPEWFAFKSVVDVLRQNI
jgi:sulfate adenylyltransferase